MKIEKVTVGTEWPLEGLLTLPEGDGPFPGVVLVHGSGANDMDENIGKCAPFKDLAEGFAKHGIATIRYNKRTYTHGKRMAKELKGELTVFEETIEDAILATKRMKEHSSIDPAQVFILGHSMGGNLAPRIDAEGGDYRGIIIWGGSWRRFEEFSRDQQEDFLAKQKGLMKWIAGKQIRKLQAKYDNIYKMTDEEAKTTTLFGKYMYCYYLKEWGDKPISNYLSELEKPVLVMQGDKDFHVSVEKDFNGYQEILANKEGATCILYPGLNHLFMKSIYHDVNKAMKEYKVPQQVEEYVIQDLADWIRRNH